MLILINTAATVATLVVLAAAAIAALVQLSHMRANNQLQVFIDIYNRAQSPEMQEALDHVLEVPKMLEVDPDYLKRVTAGTQPIRSSPLQLAFLYDELGIALRQGLVRPALMFQLGAVGYRTVRDWQLMSPIIEAVRKRAPNAFLHFEYAAVKAKQWLDTHPQGDYPRDTPRWNESW